jgi:hypothetical protein
MTGNLLAVILDLLFQLQGQLLPRRFPYALSIKLFRRRFDPRDPKCSVVKEFFSDVVLVRAMTGQPQPETLRVP